MKRMTRCLCASLVLLGALSGLHAQHAVSASGGDASGSGGSSSYSLGQVVYTAVAGSSGTLTQGVQLPFEITRITGGTDSPEIVLDLEAFPNPATDHVVLKRTDAAANTLTYRLTDLQGRLLHSGPVTGTETRISMSGLAPSSYFISVLDESKPIAHFQIVKK
ncbi:MAG: T9SS type A sorting domain-containing protein [Bacteroidales bacterium]